MYGCICCDCVAMQREAPKVTGVDFQRLLLDHLVMSNRHGFWSYVHADNEAEHGRIVELGQDLVSQVEMLSGDTVTLFIDRDSLEWGVRWKSAIDESLAETAFFVPICTPRYFNSAQCRRELQVFSGRANAAGQRQLILPILYLETPELNAEVSTDHLVTMVADYQWVDWTPYRFEDRNSPAYRQAVSGLAARLVKANRELDQLANAVAISGGAGAGDNPKGSASQETAESEDDSPGVFERIAEMEAALPNWQATLEAAADVIVRIGEAFTEGTADLDSVDQQKQGMAGRLTVTRRLAVALAEPSQEILELGNAASADLATVDTGVRLLIEEATNGNTDVEDAKQFLQQILDLAAIANQGLAPLETMVDGMRDLERYSRQLRPPFQKMRRGLTMLTNARQVMNEWVALIAAHPLPDNSSIDLKGKNS
jgi:hypothetical protein